MIQSHGLKKERFDRREQNLWGFPGSPVVENPLASAGDAEAEALIPGSGRCSLLQCSCLGNPRDRGARQAAVHGVTKSQARPSH